MQKRSKIVSGTVAAIILAAAGGLSLTGAALATPAPTPPATSTVTGADTETNDDVAGADTETNDDVAGADTETNDDVAGADTETNDAPESATESTADDVNGVAVEDGTKD